MYIALQYSKLNDNIQLYCKAKQLYKKGSDYLKNTISSQMLKGILEGCILKIISQKEVYGYEMNLKLKEYGITTVSDGTIYPLLLKLQKQELIVGEMRSSDEGPMRKYYSLTDKGKLQLEIFERQWEDLSNSVNNILSIK